MKNRRFGLNCRIPCHSNSLRSWNMCWHVYTQALSKMTGADVHCSLGGADNKVGNLNTILVRGGGNLNDPIFKSSNARGLPGWGGCWSFELIGAKLSCPLSRIVTQWAFCSQHTWSHGHMVHAEGKAAHWDIQNKDHSNLSWWSRFVLDAPVGSLPSSMYHVTASCKRPICHTIC